MAPQLPWLNRNVSRTQKPKDQTGDVVCSTRNSNLFSSFGRLKPYLRD